MQDLTEQQLEIFWDKFTKVPTSDSNSKSLKLVCDNPADKFKRINSIIENVKNSSYIDLDSQKKILKSECGDIIVSKQVDLDISRSCFTIIHTDPTVPNKYRTQEFNKVTSEFLIANVEHILTDSNLEINKQHIHNFLSIIGKYFHQAGLPYIGHGAATSSCFLAQSLMDLVHIKYKRSNFIINLSKVAENGIIQLEEKFHMSILDNVEQESDSLTNKSSTREGDPPIVSYTLKWTINIVNRQINIKEFIADIPDRTLLAEYFPDVPMFREEKPSSRLARCKSVLFSVMRREPSSSATPSSSASATPSSLLALVDFLP